jgi:hypothetical protein
MNYELASSYYIKRTLSLWIRSNLVRMNKKSVLVILPLLLCGCSGSNSSVEKILESTNYILCVEVDEANSESNEALKEPKGDYISIITSPLNAEESIYRNEITKRRFRFFCSSLSEWSFDKVSLTRGNQYKLRRVFHHEPDGADLLITSTWFLIRKIPQTNTRDLDIVNSVVFSEQVHRLRNLEQSSFCLQPRLVMSMIQAEMCSRVLLHFKSKHSERLNEALHDAEIMQSKNMGN